MNRRLPKSVEVDGKEYPINRNGDYEVILDVIEVLHADDLTEKERAVFALTIFYDYNIPENMEEALKKMMWFIACGEEDEENSKPTKPLVSWEKDFPLMVAPINRVIGYDVRSVDYCHWWTFISAYLEIGECMFATVVSIRNKLQKGKKLDKSEQEFYREHKKQVDLKTGTKYSAEEEEFFKDLLGVDFKG